MAFVKKKKDYKINCCGVINALFPLKVNYAGIGQVVLIINFSKHTFAV